MSTDHASPGELQRAHNEGQAWPEKSKDMSTVHAFFTEGPSIPLFSTPAKIDELSDAFHKGKENASS